MSGIFVSRFSLPLLAKELIERANQKRTYQLRVLAGVAFALAFLIEYWEGMTGAYSLRDIKLLGSGAVFFTYIAMVNMVVVYVLIPLLIAGSITNEKERGTLAILMTSRMTAMDILLQKTISGLIPAFMLLLISMPLVGVAYALGGLDVSIIQDHYLALFCVGLMVATWSIFCSAWSATTTQSLLLVGLGLAVLYLLFVLNDEKVFGLFFVWQWETYAPVAPYPGVVALSLIYAAVVMGIAALIFNQRAFVQPKNRWLGFYRGIDSCFVWLNERLARGWTLGVKSHPLPVDQPVLWRAVYKGTLGEWRHFIRNSLILVVLGIAIGFSDFAEDEFIMLGLLFYTYIGSVLVIVKAANRERKRQTLEPILSTPITAREWIQQTIKGSNRSVQFMAGPWYFIMVFATTYSVFMSGDALIKWIYALRSMAVLYFCMVCLRWVVFYCALRFKETGLPIAIIVVSLWVGLPLFVGEIMMEDLGMFEFSSSIMLVTELYIDNEYYYADMMQFYWWVGLVFHMVLLVLARGLCWHQADRLLRR